jgi:hypothetical protein
MHTENNGIVFLRRGAEAVDETVTLEELKRSYDRRHYDDALRLLEAMAARREAG